MNPVEGDDVGALAFVLWAVGSFGILIPMGWFGVSMWVLSVLAVRNLTRPSGSASRSSE